MAKKYHVTAYTQFSVTLTETGIHLIPNVVTLQRAAITSIADKLTGLVVTTSGGQQYIVQEGVSAQQRALTAEAFGLSR